MSELAALLTGIGLVLTGISSFASLIQSLRNGRKILEIHQQTDGITKALVAATGDAAHAAGMAEGVAKGEVKAAELVTSNLSKKV